MMSTSSSCSSLASALSLALQAFCHPSLPLPLEGNSLNQCLRVVSLFFPELGHPYVAQSLIQWKRRDARHWLSTHHRPCPWPWRQVNTSLSPSKASSIFLRPRNDKGPFVNSCCIVSGPPESSLKPTSHFPRMTPFKGSCINDISWARYNFTVDPPGLPWPAPYLFLK